MGSSGGSSGGGGGAVTSVDTRVGAVTLSDRYVALAGTAAYGLGVLNQANAAAAQTYLGLTSMAPGARTTVNTSVPGQTSIDVALSSGIAGGDTLVGGSSASDNLTIGSTGNATRGFIQLRDQVLYLSEDKTLSAGTAIYCAFDTTSARTYTFSSATLAGNAITAFRFNPTVVWAANSAINSGFGINFSPILKNDTNARTVHTFTAIQSAPTVRADTGVLTADGVQSFISSPTFDTINGGTNNVASVLGYQSFVTVNAGATVSGITHYQVFDATGAGTVSTQQIGLDIPALAKATLNIGLRNASTTVYTNVNATITATTSTIPNTGTFIRLNNTSGVSQTLGGTLPVIADGQQGQVLWLINTSAQNVVLPDETVTPGSNLRLPGAASLTLGQRDTLMLMFSTNLGDWIAMGTSNN